METCREKEIQQEEMKFYLRTEYIIKKINAMNIIFTNKDSCKLLFNLVRVSDLNLIMLYNTLFTNKF